MTSSFTVSAILDKMTSPDFDIQFMACSDLYNELQRDYKLDSHSENRVILQLLKLLQDSSRDVQSLVVKCLAELSLHACESHLQGYVKSLLDRFLQFNQEEARDVAAISLKAIVSNFPKCPHAAVVIQQMTPRFVSAISPAHADLTLEILEILTLLIRKSSNAIAGFTESLLTAVLPLLQAPRLAVVKRAATCLADLFTQLPDPLFELGLAEIHKQLSAGLPPPQLTSFVHALTSICRRNATRFSSYLNQFIPLVLNITGDHRVADDDDLRENCLQALETFVTYCPSRTSPFVKEIVELFTQCLSYDPNYAGDFSDNEMEEDEDSDEEDYSDEEDVSWKVRRAAAKGLTAVFSSRPDLFPSLYRLVWEGLAARFSEREESVRLDIFGAFAELIVSYQRFCEKHDPRAVAAADEQVAASLPRLCPLLTRELAHRNPRIAAGALGVISKILDARPAILHPHLSALFSAVAACARPVSGPTAHRTSSTALWLAALDALTSIVKIYQVESLPTLVPALFQCCEAAISDPYYKICASGLILLSVVITAINPAKTPFNPVGSEFAPKIFDLAFATLQRHDVDQEVKEGAIFSVSLCISLLGHALTSAQVSRALPVLYSRLCNEVTRLAAVHAFARLAAMALPLDLTTVFPQLVEQLVSFLRKNDRALRAGALECLYELTAKNCHLYTPDMINNALCELVGLIDTTDLQLAHTALRVALSLVRAHTASIAAVPIRALFVSVLRLVHSSVLQGPALQDVLAFLTILVSLRFDGLTYDYVLQALVQPVVEGSLGPTYYPPPRLLLHLPPEEILTTRNMAPTPTASTPSPNARPQKNPAAEQTPQDFVPLATIASAAQSAAVVCVQGTSQQCNNTVARFIADAQAPRASDRVKLLALLALGEIGRRNNLSAHSDIIPAIVSNFEHSNEEVKSTAAITLGDVAVGNASHFLPYILNEMASSKKALYMLLYSVRQLLHRLLANANQEAADSVMDSFSERLLMVLMAQTESEDEGVRAVVAECFACVCTLCPARLPQTANLLHSAEPSVRVTGVLMLKYTLHLMSPAAASTHIVPLMSAFVETLKDPSMEVRRAALLTLNYYAHNKMEYLTPYLNDIMPAVYDDARLKPELVREIDLGPFKHKVDDGLENRKCAFEVLHTLSREPLACDTQPMLARVIAGLSDKEPDHDICLLSHMILIRLASSAPQVVLSALEEIVPPLRTALTKRMKESPVKQEMDRNEEKKRSAMRVVAALSDGRVAEAHQVKPYADLLALILATPPLYELYVAIKTEMLGTTVARS